jgi:HAD superfamily hydrolase (TIGR01509 family)
MFSHMLRALVFDFDGLILDTETPLIDSYAEVHAAYGVPFDRQALLDATGDADFAFDPWHGFSPHADRAALEIERRAHKNEMTWRQPILPGVVAMIEAARGAKLRLGVASNSSHTWVDRHLERLDLLPYFECIACRGDAPSPKPEPDLYRLVLQRFGLSGHEAVAFEDSRTGVLAAKRANLWVVAVPNEATAHQDFSEADRRVGSLEKITLAELQGRF